MTSRFAPNRCVCDKILSQHNVEGLFFFYQHRVLFVILSSNLHMLCWGEYSPSEKLYFIALIASTRLWFSNGDTERWAVYEACHGEKNLFVNKPRGRKKKFFSCYFKFVAFVCSLSLKAAKSYLGILFWKSSPSLDTLTFYFVVRLGILFIVFQ